MKKLFTIFALLTITFFVTLPLYAGNQTMLGDVLQVRRAAAPPAIDGELDDIWVNVQALTMAKFEGVPRDSIMNFDDHSSTVRVMWDASAIYFLLTVMDDSSYGLETASPWLNDAIEMFFDGGNEDAASYDANDIQWRWVRDETPENNPAGDGPGTWVWMDFDGGYCFELQINQDQLLKNAAEIFSLVADTEIGYEVSSADRETAAGTRQDVLHWWTDNAYTWQQPASFGTALLTDQEVTTTLVAPKANVPPAIDGVISEGEWDQAEELALTKFEGAGIAWPMDSTLLTWKDHSSSFRIMWDESALYVCLKAYDDSSYGLETASPWLNDCIEMFFDGGNEDAASYDANDIQWRWVRDETPENNPAGDGPGTWVWQDTDDGYIFELQINQDQLLKNAAQIFTLVGDTEIGYEISNGDRESAPGTRQDVRHWWTDNAYTWQQPASFGTVLLGTTSVRPDAEVVNGYILNQNYPNPFNPTTNISYTLPKTEKVKVVVYNLLGDQVAQLVNTTQHAGPHTIAFDATNLASGVYFYQLEAGSISLVKKMMFIK